MTKLIRQLIRSDQFYGLGLLWFGTLCIGTMLAILAYRGDQPGWFFFILYCGSTITVLILTTISAINLKSFPMFSTSSPGLENNPSYTIYLSRKLSWRIYLGKPDQIPYNEHITIVAAAESESIDEEKQPENTLNNTDDSPR